ncbi:bifunctional [glutamate--ammonia ligase]-adenylyl-L-tyrosine phosphorylase/[glutamate--ammonia-ligase] adenylyltransferase [Desulfobacter hydrogenophilus]|uniref:Bifunctional [glutamate--ammonia ligase]-adenylyl-L-tyrosine phosphorylase/[glutamate--ammonia-ligase] adenylyltransferase n=1 Tax=Desulfobacter hydrogenophilus TaxID=2291 RepID=A0A328F787_9BACT|nr:bifunctional [glutamate--ammonia ligase]-adenylyl-L-tyrosine phosphorylase/[glutamate--ammonia-ligase] adenylyltransferase [Desulfobacter hydrogenophilus]NDY74366.1 bifunctional [glutamate--ammonia ligase]-adenylyl-L-tyrosine phosphorylase/[glutamate--ammonia-ligase] adenylyltransferase [Desulfobacter hydrogenophilus]QBH12608.1 bifunctional [glutamate--ammonia ligase]-adenylyl-L-tyrosine phosphorylase/[glutamate--ammonia-ligase] adenylyltransferase [Desulfobacter hydrogenophilus]RAM00086.1 bi
MTQDAIEQLISRVFPALAKPLYQALQRRIQDYFSAGNIQDISQLPVNAQDFTRVMLFSPFTAEHITAKPLILDRLGKSGDLDTSYAPGDIKKKLAAFIGDNQDSAGLKARMLEFKVYEIIRIAWRDLTGAAPLSEIMMDLSDLACACISSGFEQLYPVLTQKWGTPKDSNGKAQNIVVLGMGKLGAGELNFSSDIDLIFVYPDSGQTDGDRSISNDEFFTKLCREFIKLFSMGNGTHFYRVDTRLRPFGDSGPLVMDASAFEHYYQSQGREWERYAMIKASPVAGDIAAGNTIIQALKPFIFRRYLDYGAFDSFRDMKQRITLQVKNAKLKHNIKIGAGGIREIEFFGQLFQLIRGGVEPALQARPILLILDTLVEKQLIEEKECDELKDAYHFLRLVENRLQAYQDRQTHDIPEDPLQRQILALSMGYEDEDAFYAELSRIQGIVHKHFSILLVQADDEDEDSSSQELEQIWDSITDPQFQGEDLSISGYQDTGSVVRLLKALAAHPNTRQLSQAGRNKLSQLLPHLIKKVGEHPDADEVMAKLIDLVATIERRTCYLSLLIENKGALDNLIVLARKSPWIISFLSQHPVLLDELMDPVTLYSPPKRDMLEREMERSMSRVPEGDLELLLEELNIFRQINTLRVAAADVSGNFPLMKVSDHLTWIAETILNQVVVSSWQIVTEKYGYPKGMEGKGIEGCGFIAVAYGKVGGLEMGYKSDIDMVFIFDAEPGYTSGTERSVDITRFYSNLGQRIVHALSMHTPAGTLYGADMRLRPGGDSGTIITHLQTYEDYLKDQAWTFEHQALIRARPVAGDPALFKRFDIIRKKILTRKRDDAILKKEVGQMREKMRAQRLKYEPGQFNLKQGRGGIVDIEFLVQYLVLRHACDHPDVVEWTDNIRLLEALSVDALISGEDSGILQNAYVNMRKTIHRLTLQERSATVDEDLFSDQAAKVAQIYDAVFMS